MKKTLIVMALLTTACGGGEWPESEQQAFIENCEQESRGAAAYCECALEKIQDKEAHPEAVTIADMKDAARECSSEL